MRDALKCLTPEMKRDLRVIDSKREGVSDDEARRVKGLISEVYLFEEKVERVIVCLGVSSENFHLRLHNREVWTEELFFRAASMLEGSFQDIKGRDLKILKNLQASSLQGSGLVLQSIPKVIELFISIYIRGTSERSEKEFKEALVDMEKWTQKIGGSKLRPHVQLILSYLLLLHKDVETNDALFG